MITPLPTPPLRSDGPATFADRGDAFLSALPVFVTEANALEVNAEASADAASASADAASDSAAAAELSQLAAAALTGASKWVSGTTYSIGDVRWSPANSQSYRRKTNGAGTTDPASDATNWAQIAGVPVQTGHSGKFLTTDGTSASWAIPLANSTFQEFTSSGTWAKPATAKFVYVECVGGGGSGDAVATTDITHYANEGGQGGAWFSDFYSAADLPATVSVVVGAGGAAVVANTTSVLVVGNLVGGDSSFNGRATTIKVAGWNVGDKVLKNTLNGGGCSPPIPPGFSLSAPGTSIRHGNAGAGHSTIAANAVATSGTFPGGGGGVAYVRTGTGFTATSGAGADGVVRVWCW